MDIDKPVQVASSLHRISYAQNMEDILLDRLFGDAKGTFMDVGANHPFLDSNTYFFYLRGWRGVNIEPTRAGHALFLEHRPEDINLAIAASDAEGELPFYEISGGEGLTGLSTLSAEIAEEHRAQGFDVVEYRVPVHTVASVVREYRLDAPDILSIDVEGHEGAVIRGLPLDSWRPKVLVIEAILPQTHAASHRSWEPILAEHGYVFATFNGVNRVYLRDDLSDHLERLATPVSVLDHYKSHETIYYRHIAERLRDELDLARFHFDQERGGWAWGVSQARYIEAIYEQEQAVLANERQALKALLAQFEQARADWDWERKGYQYDRGAWEQARATFEAERSTWERQKAALEAERVQVALERAAWARDREELAQMLHEARTQLKPYRLIDRMGVVTKGYGLARRVKRKLAS
jgi:FkbM family methyltransferase